MIDGWPEEETLAYVHGEEFSGGGLAHNLVVDVAKFDLDIPLEAVGFVGDDDDGRKILALCDELGADTSHLQVDDTQPTSYTEVMTVQTTGKRTFFHSRGANNLVTADTVPYTELVSKIAHVGYLLLSDGMDAENDEYGSEAAEILHNLQRVGIKTSIDTVSENSDRFLKLIPPALKYTDYVILNEFEAGHTTGHSILKDDMLDASALKESAKRLMGLGESELVVIHMTMGAYAITDDGKELFQPSLDIPEEYIQGGAGAGDAFCAGVLVGLHEGWELEDGLRFGTAAATACMSNPTCTEGIRSHLECMDLLKQFEFRPSAL
jgi:sugar/nucleoside kinase (ribokinase family)